MLINSLAQLLGNDEKYEKLGNNEKTFLRISKFLLSNCVLYIVISRLKRFHKKLFPYEINKNHLSFVD